MLRELTIAPPFQRFVGGIRWRTWLQKGILATADQGLISGANFFLNILLARWLSPAGYGAYALVFYIVLLLTSVHQALVLEPMSVLGGALESLERPDYIRTLLRMNAMLGIALSVLFAIAALIARTLEPTGRLAACLAGLALAVPWVLLLGVLRGGSYLELAPGPAAVSALIYSGVLLAGVWIFHLHGALSVFIVVAWTGASTLLAALLLWAQVKPARDPHRSGSMGQVWRDHWNYGRWPLLATPLTFIRENIFFTFTGACLGLESAGVLQGMFNFVLPLTQLASCLSRLFQPHLAGIAVQGGHTAVRAGVKKIAFVFAGIGGTYALFLFGFHASIVRVMYGGRFSNFSGLASWMGLTGLCYLAAYVPALGLRAIQSPSAVVVAYAGAAIASLALGFPLIWYFQLHGAIAGLCISNLVSLVVATVLFRKKTQGARKMAA
jgi:O-antigen/teichoic acid export membrane protein